MARIYTYTVVLVGMSLLLAMAGFDTGVGTILDVTGVFDVANNEFTTQNVKDSGSFWNRLFDSASGILIGAGLTGAAVSFLTRSSPIPFILISFVLLLASFVIDMVGVIQFAASQFGKDSYITYLVGLLLAPIAIGYSLSLIDYWRGTD